MRKKLLSEAQVRRFQSLASIKPLNEMDSSYKMHDDEDEAAMKDDMMEAEDEDMDMDADEDADADAGEDVGFSCSTAWSTHPPIPRVFCVLPFVCSFYLFTLGYSAFSFTFLFPFVLFSFLFLIIFPIFLS